MNIKCNNRVVSQLFQASLIVVVVILATINCTGDNSSSARKGDVSLIRILDQESVIAKSIEIYSELTEAHKLRLKENLEDESHRLGMPFDLQNYPAFPVQKYMTPVSKVTARSIILASGNNINSTFKLSHASNELNLYVSFIDLAIMHCNLDITISELKSGKNLLKKTFNLFGWDSKKWKVINEAFEGSKGMEVELDISFHAEQDYLDLLIGNPVIKASNKKSSAEEGPNIILMSLDTLRGDHLSVNGYFRETTPTIDKIAREGANFSNVHSQAHFTHPSHKSMLSGYYPQIFSYYSNVQGYKNRKLTEETPLFSRYLKQDGYYTAAFTQGGQMSASYGYNRDFDIYEQTESRTNKIPIKSDDPALKGRVNVNSGFNEAIDWLQNNHDNGKFFMFFHTYTAHSDYAFPLKYDQYFEENYNTTLPPHIRTNFLLKYINEPELLSELSEDDLKHIVRAYDRTIRFLDDEIARFYNTLEELNLLENTIIIITSDHGEEFLEHGRFMHSQMYEENLRVPLIIRYPKLIKANENNLDTYAKLIDIAPTIFDLMGSNLKPVQAFHGDSLLPAMTGNQFDRQLVDFGNPFRWLTVKKDNFKYHLNWKFSNNVYEELYDLDQDPGEQNNLLTNSDEIPTEIRNELFTLGLYHIAENTPGWNLLIMPKENRKKYVVNVENFSIDPRATIKNGKEFVLRSDIFDLLQNRNQATINNVPTLFLLNGSYEDFFTLDIRKKSNSEDPRRKGIRIAAGLMQPIDMDFPVKIQSGFKLNRSFPLWQGLPKTMFDQYDIIIWENRFKFKESLYNLKNIVSDETIEELRNLGYIN